MGLSSSQARLLSLTARMHDLEYKAQNILTQKLQLATQRDDAYQVYCDALDAKKIQIACVSTSGNDKYIDATFASVAKYSTTQLKQYALRDSKTNKVIVERKVYDAYMDSGGGMSNDKYAFAIECIMGGGSELQSYFRNNYDYDNNSATEALPVGSNAIGYSRSGSVDSNGYSKTIFMSEVEEMVFYKYKDSDVKLSSSYDRLVEADKKWKADLYDTSIKREANEALNTFREYLYNTYGSEIYKYMCLDHSQMSQYLHLEGNESSTLSFTHLSNGAYDCNEQNGRLVTDDSKLIFDSRWDQNAYSKAELNYYMHLFDEIQASGGCMCVDDIEDENVGTNESFNKMVTSGRMLIDYFDTDSKEWIETSVATCVTENYIQEVSDDTDTKKAEAEYEYVLDKINKKDTDFDQELSKLETEKSATEKEIESLKTTINDHVEKHFNIFN